MKKVEFSRMKSVNMKNVAITVLSIFVLGWLLFAWVPMIRKDNEAFDKTEEVLRNSKSTVEKTQAIFERIEKTPAPRIPQAPAGDGMTL